MTPVNTQKPQEALQRPNTPYTAQPPSGCLNGCQAGTGPARGPVLVHPPTKLCPDCVDKLRTWLRQLPDDYALLRAVMHPGSTPTGTIHRKHPDPPAPLHLEILDLLDTRRGIWYTDDGRPMLSDNRRGLFGVILAWSSTVRQERGLERTCDCGHRRHTGSCPCGCRKWHVTTTLTRECALLSRHLPWICEQDWVHDMCTELRPLVRRLTLAVGGVPRQPTQHVGFCVALIGGEVCGGKLYRDDNGPGVRCVACGDWTDTYRLQELGSRIGLIDGDPQEAS